MYAKWPKTRYNDNPINVIAMTQIKRFVNIQNISMEKITLNVCHEVRKVNHSKRYKNSTLITKCIEIINTSIITKRGT